MSPPQQLRPASFLDFVRRTQSNIRMDIDASEQRRNILRGIDSELAKATQCIEFQVANRQQLGAVWIVSVDLTKTDSAGLDESLEGSNAWWPGPPKGAADVLSVVPEAEQINLRFATTAPPTAGGKLLVYPPRYLEALRDCWSNDLWAERSLLWLKQLESANAFQPERIPSTEGIKGRLRDRQARAIKLLGFDAGFLWGPPGTGKTYTLGFMLGQFLVERPSARVLLLSTTNSAVDQALIAADKALEVLTNRARAAAAIRKHCVRVGNHFIASHYKAREHLLPVKDDNLIRRLTALEAERPDNKSVQAYASWKSQVELVRNAIRQQAIGVLDHARLAAMTTTRAAFTFGDLAARSPYDLVVFDEASQVGIAHALALAPLGRQCIFAGDPQQLAPIVQSSNPAAERWLGQSMFVYRNESADSTCMLNEQSRMAEPICRIVSNVFYGGRLLVAADCKHNREWARHRDLVPIRPMGSRCVHVENSDKEGTWSQKYHGPIRFTSAEFIRDLVCELTRLLDTSDIIVLTPFRAQRTLIRTFLQNAGCGNVSVSTVHRAQGSERHTVIFDPVMGDTPFLRTDDAPRLINVAISRAQARLVVIMSPGDRRNPLFDQIYNVIENLDTFREAVPIANLIKQARFPASAMERVVQIKGMIGRIVHVHNNGERFEVLDFHTGKRRTFITSYLRKTFS